MDALTNFLVDFLRHLAIGPVLFAVLALLFIYVMTRNYLRLRHEKLTPDLLEGEESLDQLEVDLGLLRTRTLLTNRRILQLRLYWFLSRRYLLPLALGDVHSVAWKRYANWICILVGLCFIGTLNPFALLLVLYGLQGKVYTVRFQTPFAQMPRTRLVVTTLHRNQLGEFVRFYRNAQATWARIRAEKGLPAGPAPASAIADRETDFLWGRPVWAYVTLLLILGFLQRVLQPHLSFDDYFFAPIYLGLPLAVASRSARDSLWTAILGFAALFTMKFPGSGLLGVLTGDGRSPYLTQYLFVMLTLVLMVLIASTLARYLHPSVAFIAAPLWLGFVGLHMPAVFFDYGLYTKVALAVAAAILLAWLERGIGRVYGATA